mmetsp:Transcript_60961/g.145272  ORF Transcript_60961/g.145272 Transcript_60961/m.145272 type:complete len:425 (-) Transcript_60961:57-1331(-)
MGRGCGNAATEMVSRDDWLPKLDYLGEDLVEEKPASVFEAYTPSPPGHGNRRASPLLGSGAAGLLASGKRTDVLWVQSFLDAELGSRAPMEVEASKSSCMSKSSSAAAYEPPSRHRTDDVKLLSDTLSIADFIGYAGDVCWLLKELSWILLVPSTSLVYGFAAMMCMNTAAILGRNDPTFHLVPQVACAVWLTSNFTVMFGELLFEAPDVQTPWGLTPMVVADEESAKSTRDFAIVGFIGAFSLLLMGALGQAYEHWSKRCPDNFTPILSIILQMHTALWILSDLFEILEMRWPALTCTLLAGVKVGVASWVRPTLSQNSVGLEPSDASVLLWVCSSAAWMVCESFYDGNLHVRYFAATLCLVSVLLMFYSFTTLKDRCKETQDLDLEAKRSTSKSPTNKLSLGSNSRAALLRQLLRLRFRTIS